MNGHTCNYKNLIIIRDWSLLKEIKFRLRLTESFLNLDLQALGRDETTVLELRFYISTCHPLIQLQLVTETSHTTTTTTTPQTLASLLRRLDYRIL